MQLSEQSAQRIVREIGALVGQDINMMDEQGFIIASTDASRIGFFHAGAYQIITQHLSELYIHPQDVSANVRNGLNLPITHRGETVGVIGITGAYEQVVGYGQVVKKMTEILIRESTEQDEKRLDLRVRSRFLEDWVLGTTLQPEAALAERGLALGIDTTSPRRVMVVSVQELEQYVTSTDGQKCMDAVETAIADYVETEPGGIVLRNAARQIILVRQRSTAQMYTLAQRLCTMVRQSFSVQLCAGIDGGDSEVHRAYVQANTAWRSARTTHGGIMGYDQMTLELFVGDVPRHTKLEFLRKVFRGCTYDEMRRWMTVLGAYFDADGSLNAASAALYMHKNTLQYKLKKLEELTGYDVRRPMDAPVFYMALLVFKELDTSLSLCLGE